MHIHERGSCEQSEVQDKILYINFDGTTNSIRDEVHNSVMTSLHNNTVITLSHDCDCLYLQGPGSKSNDIIGAASAVVNEDLSEYSIDKSVQCAIGFFESHRDKNYQKIIINGYSRGCLSAVKFNNRLHELGVELPVYMQLLDPTHGLHELNNQYSLEEMSDRYVINNPSTEKVVIYERAREAEYDAVAKIFPGQARVLQRVRIITDNLPEHVVHHIPVDTGHLELNGLQPRSFTEGLYGLKHIYRQGYLAASVRAADNIPRLQQTRNIIHEVSNCFINNPEVNYNQMFDKFFTEHGHHTALEAFDPQSYYPSVYCVKAVSGLVRSMNFKAGFFGDEKVAPQSLPNMQTEDAIGDDHIEENNGFLRTDRVLRLR